MHGLTKVEYNVLKKYLLLECPFIGRVVAAYLCHGETAHTPIPRCIEHYFFSILIVGSHDFSMFADTFPSIL